LDYHQSQRKQKQKMAISMDGRGAWRDNLFVERLWRSMKYEDVYLRAQEQITFRWNHLNV
jgi:putative transposase